MRYIWIGVIAAFLTLAFSPSVRERALRAAFYRDAPPTPPGFEPRHRYWVNGRQVTHDEWKRIQ